MNTKFTILSKVFLFFKLSDFRCEPAKSLKNNLEIVMTGFRLDDRKISDATVSEMTGFIKSIPEIPANCFLCETNPDDEKTALLSDFLTTFLYSEKTITDVHLFLSVSVKSFVSFVSKGIKSERIWIYSRAFHDMKKYLDFEVKNNTTLMECFVKLSNAIFSSWLPIYPIDSYLEKIRAMYRCIDILLAKTLFLPMQMLGADLQAHKVIYNNNPVLKWCLTNTGIQTDRNGNIVPIKDQSPKQRIDGTAALLDCYVGLYEHYNEYTQAI